MEKKDQVLKFTTVFPSKLEDEYLNKEIYSVQV